MSVLKFTCNVQEQFRIRPRLIVSALKRHISILPQKKIDKIEENVQKSEPLENITPEQEQEIERIRDKSKLKPQHRNILFGKKPYSEPLIKAHLSIKYNRKLYGKYGSESGVNPGIMWPTKEDLEKRREYESVAYPFTIQELVESAKKELQMKEQEREEVHQKVISKLAKLDQWKKDLKDKIAKKEAEAVAAKEKKDKLIEEVRRHFGFTVSPKDERFQEMLAAKEKEQRKKEKRVKEEEKENKALARMMSKNEELLASEKTDA